MQQFRRSELLTDQELLPVNLIDVLERDQTGIGAVQQLVVTRLINQLVRPRV